MELTLDQLKTINDKLGESAANKAAVDDAVKALDAISDNVKNISGLSNKINAVKTVLSMMPAGVPAGNDVPEKSVDFSESAKDPVNNYFDED